MITLQLNEEQVSALKDAIDWITKSRCLRPDIVETLQGVEKSIDFCTKTKDPLLKIHLEKTLFLIDKKNVKAILRKDNEMLTVDIE